MCCTKDNIYVIDNKKLYAVGYNDQMQINSTKNSYIEMLTPMALPTHLGPISLACTKNDLYILAYDNITKKKIIYNNGYVVKNIQGNLLNIMDGPENIFIITTKGIYYDNKKMNITNVLYISYDYDQGYIIGHKGLWTYKLNGNINAKKLLDVDSVYGGNNDILCVSNGIDFVLVLTTMGLYRKENKTNFTKVPINNVKYVCCISNKSFVLTNDGKVYMLENDTRPILIINNISAMESGYNNVIARDTNNNYYKFISYTNVFIKI